MKKIEYTEESRKAAAMLGNLLAVRYADSVNPDHDDVYRSAIALTTGMGLGKATMGQISDIVEEVVRFYSVEDIERRSAKRIKAYDALVEAERRLLEAKNALTKAERIYRMEQEQPLMLPLRFSPDSFRFMR